MAKDNRNRLAGLAFLTVDGNVYLVAGDFTYSPTKVKRETLIGMDYVHGYKESPNQCFISATLRDHGGLSVQEINDMTNVTVSVELANGKNVTGRNMWTVEAQEVKAEDGTIDVRFEGFEVEEF